MTRDTGIVGYNVQKAVDTQHHLIVAKPGWPWHNAQTLDAFGRSPPESDQARINNPQNYNYNVSP
jgi:hypothetical protein